MQKKEKNFFYKNRLHDLSYSAHKTGSLGEETEGEGEPEKTAIHTPNTETPSSSTNEPLALRPFILPPRPASLLARHRSLNIQLRQHVEASL